MHGGITRGRGRQRRQVVGQRIDDRVLPAQHAQQGRGIGGVDDPRCHGIRGQFGQRVRAAVDDRDLVITAAAEQAGDGLADVAGAKQGDAHGVLSSLSRGASSLGRGLDESYSANVR